MVNNHDTAARLDRELATGTITRLEHEALTLRFVNELSQRQIAQALNVTRWSVRDRIRSGLTKIARKDAA